jgi:bis(5'-nucleosidyl)-tetraphosphatase
MATQYNAKAPTEISCGVMPIALFGKEARVLILKQTFAGEDYWGFPKGHKEKGEDDTETASRELKEETNLEISQIIRKAPFECSYSFMREGAPVAKRAKYFLAYVKQPESLVLNSEGLDFKWVPIDFVQDYLSHDTMSGIWKEATHHIYKAAAITSLFAARGNL